MWNCYPHLFKTGLGMTLFSRLYLDSIPILVLVKGIVE